MPDLAALIGFRGVPGGRRAGAAYLVFPRIAPKAGPKPPVDMTCTGVLVRPAQCLPGISLDATEAWPFFRFFFAPHLGPKARSPSSGLWPFCGWEGSPSKIDCRKRGALILTSLLENLEGVLCGLSVLGCHPRKFSCCSAPEAAWNWAAPPPKSHSAGVSSCSCGPPQSSRVIWRLVTLVLGKIGD